MKRILTMVLASGLAFGFGAFGAQVAGETQLTKTLSSVPAAELPVKCAELVRAAKSRDRGFTTVSVVKTAATLNPAAAPAIVAAVAKGYPDMASIAAGAAAEVQPGQAADIARAAAAAAPSKAAKIAVSVCRAVPISYRNIAVASAQGAPGSGQDILRSIASAFPELKPGIDAALLGYGANPPSVAAVLDSVKPSASGATILSANQSPGSPEAPATYTAPARGPSLAPPFVPISTTPTNVNPSTSGTVPRGGRTYAAP
jgi:hypothetical protein